MTKKPSNPLKFFNDKADERVKKMQAGGTAKDTTWKPAPRELYTEKQKDQNTMDSIRYESGKPGRRTKEVKEKEDSVMTNLKNKYKK